MELFTFIFSIVTGAICFWASIRFLRIFFKVKKWDRIKAKVVSKQMEIHAKYSTSRSPYAVKAEYEYNYKGDAYTSNNIYLVELLKGQANHMEQTAKNKFDKIQNEMTVYVNPENPSEAVMFCEGVGLYFFILIVGLLSMLIGTSYFFNAG